MRRLWPASLQLQRSAALRRVHTGSTLINVPPKPIVATLRAVGPVRWVNSESNSLSQPPVESASAASFNESQQANNIDLAIDLIAEAFRHASSSAGSSRALPQLDDEALDRVVQALTVAWESAKTDFASERPSSASFPAYSTADESAGARPVSSVEREFRKAAQRRAELSCASSSATEVSITGFSEEGREFLVKLRPYAHALSANLQNRMKTVIASNKQRDWRHAQAMDGDAESPNAVSVLSKEIGSVAQACFLCTYVDVLPQATKTDLSAFWTGQNQKQVAAATRSAYETWLTSTCRQWLQAEQPDCAICILDSLTDTLSRMASMFLDQSPAGTAYYNSSEDADDSAPMSVPSHKTLRLLRGSSKARMSGSAVDLAHLWLSVYRKTLPESDLLSQGVVDQTMAALTTLDVLDESVSGIAKPGILWKKATVGLPSGATSVSDGQQQSMQLFAHDLVHDASLRSIPALSAQLRRLTHRGAWVSLYSLWDAVHERMIHNRKPSVGLDLSSSDTRVQVLSEFLSAFVQKAISDDREPDGDVDAAFPRLNQIVALMPSPMPLVAYHTLLAMYARSPGSFIPPITLATGPLNPLGKIAGTTAKEDALRALNAVWSAMRRDGVAPDVKAYMIYMEGLGKKGEMQGLQNAWRELHQDEGCRRREEAAAKASGHQGPILHPPISAFNHYMSLFFSMPRYPDAPKVAMSIFEYLCDPRQSYKPDLFSFNIVLRDLATRGDVQAIMSLMQRLPQFDLKPDVVTYTTLIKGLLEVDNVEGAQGVLKLMQDAGIKPTVLTYNLLISYECKHGDKRRMLKAEKMRQEIERAGFRLNVQLWTALVAGYFRAGLPREGLQHLRRMNEQGIRPDRVTYNVLLRAASGADAGELRDVSKTLRKISKAPNSAHRSDHLVCLEVLEHMYQNNVQPDSDTWYIILSGLARQDDATGVAAVLDRMNKRRFVVRPKSALARLVEDVRRRQMHVKHS